MINDYLKKTIIKKGIVHLESLEFNENRKLY